MQAADGKRGAFFEKIRKLRKPASSKSQSGPYGPQDLEMYHNRSRQKSSPLQHMVIIALILMTFLTGTLGPIFFGLVLALIMEILPLTAIIMFITFLATR
jgi:hypothetical protein